MSNLNKTIQYNQFKKSMMTTNLSQKVSYDDTNVDQRGLMKHKDGSYLPNVQSSRVNMNRTCESSLSLMSKQREIINTVKRTESEGLHKLMAAKHDFDEYGRDESAWKRSLRFEKRLEQERMRRDLRKGNNS